MSDNETENKSDLNSPTQIDGVELQAQSKPQVEPPNVVELKEKRSEKSLERMDELLSAEVDPDFFKNLQNIATIVKEETDKTNSVEPIAPSTSSVSSKLAKLKALWEKPMIKYSIIGGGLAILLPTLIFVLSQQVSKMFTLPYKPNLLGLTEKVYTFPEDDEFILLFDEVRAPIFTFSLPMITVNLVSADSSSRSYVQVTIQIDTRSQKALDLVTKKERELIDVSQRVLERLSWQELSTTNGKIQTKKNLVATMNKVLGSGTVADVFYQSFFTKK